MYQAYHAGCVRARSLWSPTCPHLSRSMPGQYVWCLSGGVIKGTYSMIPPFSSSAGTSLQTQADAVHIYAMTLFSLSAIIVVPLCFQIGSTAPTPTTSQHKRLIHDWTLFLAICLTILQVSWTFFLTLRGNSLWSFNSVPFGATP